MYKEGTHKVACIRVASEWCEYKGDHHKIVCMSELIMNEHLKSGNPWDCMYNGGSLLEYMYKGEINKDVCIN